MVLLASKPHLDFLIYQLLSVSILATSFQSGEEGVALYCNILSEQLYPTKSRGCITERSRRGNRRPSLLLGKDGRCLILVDAKWREEEKVKKADCFSPLSCYCIELETDHCSNAPTGVFFFLFFQLDVSVSNNKNLSG